MTAPIEGGKLLALPYRGPGLPMEIHTVLLDHLVAHPTWFASRMGPDEIRVAAAQMLVSPDYGKWEVWNGGQFAGMLLLSRLVQGVDALFHFTFLPHEQSGVTLFGSRRLVWNFLGYAFEQFGLERISVEVPEGKPKLISWLRQRLAFKYEAELHLDRLSKNKAIRSMGNGVNTWVAAHGSRRESAHWDGEKFSDLVLLRLLRSEYLALASSGSMPKATSETSPLEISRVSGLEAGTIPTAHPRGNAAGVPSAAV